MEPIRVLVHGRVIDFLDVYTHAGWFSSILLRTRFVMEFVQEPMRHRCEHHAHAGNEGHAAE